MNNVFGNNETTKFTLISGVEAEVKALVGKHQKLLTQQTKGTKHSDRLNLMLADILVRVGSVTNITPEFIEGMLSEDRRQALIVCRQFTMDFQKEFVYSYKYKHEGETKTFDVKVDLKEDGTFPITQMPVQYSEYADIPMQVFMVLPKSKVEVRFNLLTGKGERIGANVKKDQRSSHTIMEMRNPVYKLVREGKEDTWMKLPLDKVGVTDLDALRVAMKEAEGKIDTEIQFEHPLWESGEADEQDVVVDVLNTVNFFFPSGII